MATDSYTPRPEHKFTFGLWAVGNRGRDPFGEAVRPAMPPIELVHLLAEVGAMGVNLHDNDLTPIDATPSERDQIARSFKRACEEAGLKVPMATVNLFYDPVSRDGAFTANDPSVRAYASGGYIVQCLRRRFFLPLGTEELEGNIWTAAARIWGLYCAVSTPPLLAL